MKEKGFGKMRKVNITCILALLLCLSMGCSNAKETQNKDGVEAEAIQNTEQEIDTEMDTKIQITLGSEQEMAITKEAFQSLKMEIQTEIEAAKAGKYKNLNFLCEDVELPNSESIRFMRFPVNAFVKDMTLEEKLACYKDVVIPKLYGIEAVESNHIVDLESRDYQQKQRTYAYNYEYLLEHAEELQETVTLGYSNPEKYQFMEILSEGVCLNMSQGALGTLLEKDSPFVVGGDGWEEVKTYHCDFDDLSDSYLLIDGEKTVAEAKEEIETYLNNHYPLMGEDNGIRNEVYEIRVWKIPNTEYHVFDAYRTLSYDGIRVKEHTDRGLSSEVGVMGQAFLCESNKVDITLGFVNCFSEGSIVKSSAEILSFTEVMEKLSEDLAEDNIFDVRHIGLEYRMFTEVEDEVTYYNWIPYWLFVIENPENHVIVRIYVNMETGEIESYGI